MSKVAYHPFYVIALLVAIILGAPEAEAQLSKTDEVSAQVREEGKSRSRARVRFRGRGLLRGAQHSGPVLTREQLRQCLLLEKEINDASVGIDQESVSLDAASSKSESLAEQVARSNESVDEHSQESVDAHNALVNQYNAGVQRYNAALPGARVRVDKVNLSISEFNGRCANHAYYLHHMVAIEKGLGFKHGGIR